MSTGEEPEPYKKEGMGFAFGRIIQIKDASLLESNIGLGKEVTSETGYDFGDNIITGYSSVYNQLYYVS